MHTDALAALLSLLSSAHWVSQPHQKKPVLAAADNDIRALGYNLRVLHDAKLQASFALMILNQHLSFTCDSFDGQRPFFHLLSQCVALF